MANAYVTEYAELSRDIFGTGIAAGHEPSIRCQKVAFTGTAASSAAFNARTKFIRVQVDAIAHFKVDALGATTAATTDDTRLVAGSAEFFGVEAGGKISFVTGS